MIRRGVSDDFFRKDPRPSLYAYEQTYRVPGTGVKPRTQRGFLWPAPARPFGPGTGDPAP